MTEVFDLFREKFEGFIEYKIYNNGIWKSVREQGIIQATVQGNFMFFLIFDPEDIEVPKKAIPQHNVLVLEIAEEVTEIMAEEDEFSVYDTISATVIEGNEVADSLDVRSKIEIGTEAMGEIDLSEPEKVDF